MDIYGQDTTYIWPTNSGQFLSSTFGETRSAHFHAGLDIKTWGREGYEVYATKDGILSRLLITNKGYGKAIYLKHEDGYYTVYAHLQRFNADFQAIADSIRLTDFSYTFEEFLESANIKVKKGDLIGYTGSTGIGPPHLHYEIRNEKNQPINPLRSNLSVKDTIAPTFSSILLEPLSIDTRIFGSVYPQKIKPFKVQNDTTFYDTVYVNGSFGFSPEVFDESNSVTNKYAVYKLKLVRNGETLYSEILNKFDFEEAEMMFLNRVPEPNSNRRSYQRLFTPSESAHPFLVEEKLPVQLKSGEYSIIAEDFYGNRSTAIIPVTQSSKEKSRISRDISFDLWTNNWISINDSTNLDLRDLKSRIVWNSSENQRILNFKESLNRTVARITPNQKHKIVSPDYSITTFIQSNTFFDTVSVILDRSVINDSVFIQIGVSELTSRKDIFLQIQIGISRFSNEHLNLYKIDKDGEFDFENSWFSGSTLKASISSLGMFVILNDTTPPKVFNPKLIQLGNGRISYSIKTDDNLSGVDHTAAYFEINGLRGIPEYDYENDTFTFYHPSFQIKKENNILFKVKDRAGNFISKSFLLKN